MESSNSEEQKRNRFHDHIKVAQKAHPYKQKKLPAKTYKEECYKASLFEEQREASLDVEMLSSSPKPPSSLPSNDHIQAVNGGGNAPFENNLRAKKDGGGGKGNWAKLLTPDVLCLNESRYVFAMNYGDEETRVPNIYFKERRALHPLVKQYFFKNEFPDSFSTYKADVDSLIEDYFCTGEVDVAVSALPRIGTTMSDETAVIYHPYFVKRLVSIAMDKNDKDEMASDLLSALFCNVISPLNFRRGFAQLVASADQAQDIQVNALAQFIARAVADDILSPRFISNGIETYRLRYKVHKVLQTAKERSLPELVKKRWGGSTHITDPRHDEIVEKRWGGSTHISVEEVKRHIADLLKKYVKSEQDDGAVDRACDSISKLEVPLFHHEVVKRALVIALENPRMFSRVFALLGKAAQIPLISCDQMCQGFCRMAESLDDLVVSAHAESIPLFMAIVNYAKHHKWVTPTLAESLEREHIEKDEAYKKEAMDVIRGYFEYDYYKYDDSDEEEDFPECALIPKFGAVFLKKLITHAMDKGNEVKEKTFALLSDVYSKMVKGVDIVNGWVMLLESAADTALDAFDASNELALFLARGLIEDDIKPLIFREIEESVQNSTGAETLRMASLLLAAHPTGVRIYRCWGGDTGWAVENANDKITKLLEEYCRGDIGACACINNLGMPFSNHEFVKKALVMAMERETEGLLSMLGECFTQELITINQMTKGFIRFRDVALGFPDAQEKFNNIVKLKRMNGCFQCFSPLVWKFYLHHRQILLQLARGRCSVELNEFGGNTCSRWSCFDYLFCGKVVVNPRSCTLFCLVFLI